MLIALALVGATTIFSVECRAQSAAPSKSQITTPQQASDDKQETVSVITEEVQINVEAMDDYGRFDPTLEAADLLVLEDGVAQAVKSVRRVPASVLLLIDTGGGIRFTKDVKATREVAMNLIVGLRPEDQACIVQFSDRVELLQNWTSDMQVVAHALDTKLYPGRQARFSDAMLDAAKRFAAQPIANRHLVIITDGVEPSQWAVRRARAVEQCLAAQVTIHILSYTRVSQTAIKRHSKIVRPRERKHGPQHTEEELRLRAELGTDSIIYQFKTQDGGITIDLDFERRRQLKQYGAEARQGEVHLVDLAEQTGGRIWMPNSADEMIDSASETAHMIVAQYVVTYTPSRPFAGALNGERRRIEIVSRRVGLKLRARRNYIVNYTRDRLRQ